MPTGEPDHAISPFSTGETEKKCLAESRCRPFSSSKLPSSLFVQIFLHPRRINTSHFAALRSEEMSSLNMLLPLRWLDTVFQVQYLLSLSINYVAISKDLEKLTPQLY